MSFNERYETESKLTDAVSQTIGAGNALSTVAGAIALWSAAPADIPFAPKVIFTLAASVVAGYVSYKVTQLSEFATKELLESFDDLTDVTAGTSPSERLGKIVGCVALGGTLAAIAGIGAYLIATTPALFEAGPQAGPIMHFIDRATDIGVKLTLAADGAMIASLAAPLMGGFAETVSNGLTGTGGFIISRLKNFLPRKDVDQTPKLQS